MLNKIRKWRDEAINEYYTAIHKANNEKYPEDVRKIQEKMANIHYGRVEAFNEVINELTKK